MCIHFWVTRNSRANCLIDGALHRFQPAREPVDSGFSFANVTLQLPEKEDICGVISLKRSSECRRGREMKEVRREIVACSAVLIHPLRLFNGNTAKSPYLSPKCNIFFALICNKPDLASPGESRNYELNTTSYYEPKYR